MDKILNLSNNSCSKKDDNNDCNCNSSHFYEDDNGPCCCSEKSININNSLSSNDSSNCTANSCECNNITSIPKNTNPEVNKNYSKKEFILEGLNCAHCANKIETTISNLDGIKNLSFNFSTSKLKFQLAKDMESNILETITKIVNDLEPNVKVIDISLNSNKFNTKEFLLKGLNCAHCANKIETTINNLDEINTCSLNFSTSKIKIELENNTSENIYKKIVSIVNKFEPDVEVIDLSNERSNKTSSKKAKINPLFIKMTLTLISMGIGFLFKKESWYFIPFIIGYLIISTDIIKSSLNNIRKGQIFDENFLMLIATLGAIAVKEYPEAIMVMFLYQIGEYFQGKAVDSSRKSISNLMNIKPDYANIKKGNQIIKVSPDNISIGDVIVVKPGEKVPLDGKIIAGNSSVDTKALTGESVPQELSKGDSITSGFINIDGVLTIKVTKGFEDSAVSKILNLVENASSKKAKTELRITKFAKYYTPIVVLIAILLTIIPPLFIEGQVFKDWLIRGATFLVVSCPCALVISIPMSYFAGIGISSKKGILIKGGNYLEALSNINSLVFDKTGTLTKGNFKVDKIIPSKGLKKEDLLRYVAHVENFSNHPIALSIVDEFKGSIDKENIKNYKEIRGNGVEALVNGKLVSSGNLKFIKSKGINITEAKSSGTIIYTCIDNIYSGFISIKDEIKSDSKKAINQFKNLNINNIIMLTGDRKSTALEVSSKLGITNFKYSLLPNEKVLEVENLLQNPNNSVAFVGDGINDAPVLARANVGIAMGGVGSDAAIEAADVVIMNDEPSKIATAIKVSRFTKKIANQNIFMSIGIKLIIMILAILGLAPMWLAIFGDVGVSIIAVFNAMRILKIN